MHLGIKQRIKLVSFLPTLIVFLASSVLLFVFAQKYLANKQILTNTKIAKEVARSLHPVEQEAIKSALYLANPQDNMKSGLQKEYKKSDQILTKIKQYQSSLNLSNELALLQLVRQKTLAHQESFDRIYFALYFDAVLEPLAKKTLLALRMSGEEDYKFVYGKLKHDIYSHLYSAQETGFLAYNNIKQLYDENRQTVELALIRKADAFLDTNDNPNLKPLMDKIRSIRLSFLQNKQFNVNEWLQANEQKLNHLDKLLITDIQGIEAVANNYLHFYLIALLISLAFWLLSILLFAYIYFVLRDYDKSTEKLENLLQKVALSEDILQENPELAKGVNLDTVAGIEKAYELLHLALRRTETAREAAEEANKAKSMFLANMSHEIRTPLNGIMGFTELLKNSNLSPEQKEYVTIIEKSSENLLEIINNILDLAKIENNKIELESVVFEPIEEFENAIEVYATRAAEKNIDLALFVDPHLDKPLKGDPTKIKEVLINLISNAIKFTNKGGEIVVEIRKIGKNDANAIVQFEVRDTGIGIPQEKKEKIFEAFSQADISVTRKYGGTGLGLTISSEFLKLMGSELKLESEEGKGSRFYFTLELEEIPIVNEESLQDRFNTIKIAYYDDPHHPKTQTKFIQEYLEYFGSIFETSQDLQQTIDIAKKSNFALLDFDFVKEKGINKFILNKIPTALIAKVTYKKRLEEFNTKVIKTLTEPVNFTKLRQLLEFYVEHTQELTQKTKILASRGKIKFRAKALVAEDNIINQKLIKKTLEDFGLEVDLADNGIEALEKFKQNHYDIIFMDIQMPVKDGIEAMQEIHLYEKEMRLIPTPIIALTAHALKGDRERFMSKGFDEYITKPINRKDIETILKAFLPDKKYVAQEETEEEVTTNNQEQTSLLEKDYDYDILLLKKSPLEAKLFANVLKSLGYSVDMALDLDDFVHRLRERRYKIAFIDKESDEYNFHIIQKVRKEAPDTKFVLLVEPSFDLKQIPSIEKDFYDDIIRNIIKKDFFKSEIEKLFTKESV
ncbi:ATP-binding protein [Nitratiruptor sp. YY09-18]|uniref:hybrid sensor histidine kinase/response regulator n=1 Tax=Nitratiruptor sp. YY09-18 TaxID=2724901 RepID=UPI0019168BDD|nr:ATP-binding protein [Nitratiruptor sp. YY09-18]BCD67667.1 response regulator [Nitratiruptor sp. YY09-18]